MNRLFGSKTISMVAVSACSLFVLAGSVMAQQPGGAGGDRGNQPGGGGQGQRGNRGGGGGGPVGGGGGGGFMGGGGMFGGGGRAMFDPSVSTEDMDKYGKVLNLSKAQQTAVKALHDSFVQDYTTASEKVRDEMQALRDEEGDDRFTAMGEMMTKFRAKRADMEKTFFTDVKATLTPEQAAQWPSIERLRRRETSMNRGMMSGERVDLIKIVDGLKLSPDQKKPVDPVLEQYSVDLDRELVARNEYQEKMQGQMREMFGPNADPAKAEKMITDGRVVANKLREVNKRYARQVETTLPEEAKAKFLNEVRRESFPQIYRGSRATRQIEDTLALKSITAEQKTAIEGIKTTLERDVTSVNQRMETAYEQREQTITAADLMGRFGGGGQGGGGRGRGGFGMVDSEELTKLRDQRDETEKAAVDKVMALLNEDQKAEMPQGGRNGGGRGGRGGDAGGDNGGGNGGGGGGNAPRRGGRPGGANPPAAPTGRT